MKAGKYEYHHIPKHKSVEPGVCPVCGEAELKYGDHEFVFEQLMYEWECMNCGAEGTEEYNLEFQGMNVEKKNG